MPDGVWKPNEWPNWAKSFAGILSAIYGALFIGGSLRLILDFVASLHWLFGVVATVLVAIPTFLIIRRLERREYCEFKGPVIIGIFLLVTLMAVFVFASASMLLFFSDPNAYSPNPANPFYREVHMGSLSDFYIYLLIDAIPGLKLWDTFHVAPPMNYGGYPAALLILLFRLFVVARIIAAVKDWVGGTSGNAGYRGSDPRRAAAEGA